VSADGPRVRFFRSVGGIDMETEEVESGYAVRCNIVHMPVQCLGRWQI
jgi:hypothetical protein